MALKSQLAILYSLTITYLDTVPVSLDKQGCTVHVHPHVTVGEYAKMRINGTEQCVQYMYMYMCIINDAICV